MPLKPNAILRRFGDDDYIAQVRLSWICERDPAPIFFYVIEGWFTAHIDLTVMYVKEG